MRSTGRLINTALSFRAWNPGLFGTFYELVEMGGAELFPPDLVPQIENDGGRWALSLLRTFYAEGLVPPEIVDWHYDKVHDCFRDGHAAMVGDWPGYYADYCDPHASAVHDRFALARYPVGPQGKSLVYGGSHTFALTQQGAQSAEALALLRFLTAPEQQWVEAQQGSVPVRTSVMRRSQAEAAPVGQGALAHARRRHRRRGHPAQVWALPRGRRGAVEDRAGGHDRRTGDRRRAAPHDGADRRNCSPGGKGRMSDELSGKVIFLTGGGQGIGRECAKAYHRAGAIVAVADINLEAATDTVAALAGRRRPGRPL